MDELLKNLIDKIEIFKEKISSNEYLEIMNIIQDLYNIKHNNDNDNSSNYTESDSDDSDDNINDELSNTICNHYQCNSCCNYFDICSDSLLSTTQCNNYELLLSQVPKLTYLMQIYDKNITKLDTITFEKEIKIIEINSNETDFHNNFISVTKYMIRMVETTIDDLYERHLLKFILFDYIISHWYIIKSNNKYIQFKNMFISKISEFFDISERKKKEYNDILSEFDESLDLIELWINLIKE
jgi:hypothetical protein